MRWQSIASTIFYNGSYTEELFAPAVDDILRVTGEVAKRNELHAFKASSKAKLPLNTLL